MNELQGRPMLPLTSCKIFSPIKIQLFLSSKIAVCIDLAERKNVDVKNVEKKCRKENVERINVEKKTPKKRCRKNNVERKNIEEKNVDRMEYRKCLC
jgi:hypothetical protein